MENEIILLRGLFRGCHHWGDFPNLIQKAFPEHTITCVDIPGNGYLSSKISPNTIEGMVESVRLQRKSNCKVYILAVSMGGMIGLKWAELYPNEVASLICINTTAKEFSPFYERLLPNNYLKILMALTSDSFKREKVIYEMVSNQPINLNTVNKWASYSKLHPMKISNFWRQLYAANTFRISCPECDLHFIASEHDQLVSYDATIAIPKAWKIPVITNKTDGHDIALDNPTWLLSTIKKVWIK
ncbi:alpha/beta fold hydrolase [Photobacterium kishitanii]|uniref:alpha/beta fold hydrolase n=1 Tax=Photobacterium kishitanii TaxID=318456 RepID=UPI0007F8BDDD|nr:alpha/beta hydrolase [Photobacterium kishitanii]OBU32222.1 hydrolase [Photobacterium kishitanii]PSW50360.1 alpha/beta hydrolase [Photobacterium kishitanii]